MTVFEAPLVQRAAKSTWRAGAFYIIVNNAIIVARSHFKTGEKCVTIDKTELVRAKNEVRIFNVAYYGRV